MANDRPNHPICASVLGLAMSGLKPVRRNVVPAARGHVLELGVGTGLNFPHYDFAADRTVTVTGIEPDLSMLRRAEKEAAAHDDGVDGAQPKFVLSDASAEEMAFESETFDTVVATFVLCTIPNPDRALAEVHRVLKPGGTLLFAEHVAAASKGFAKCQDILNPAWGLVAGGCNLNRDALGYIQDAGFVDVEHRTHGNPSWSLVPIISGTAVRGVTE